MASSPNMTLKLLVDKKAQKVLFAEATKEFVDFLFHIFSLPLGNLIQFLGTEQMVGCLGQLKESIENFNQTYLKPGIDKDVIFNPETAFNGNMFLLLNDAFEDDKTATPKTLYRCINTNYSSCREYVTEHKDAQCPYCSRSMNSPVKPVIPADVVKEAVGRKRKVRRGYVKGVVTYMVMDNLVVKPMSTISSITLINTFDVKDLTQLEEKTLSFGEPEAMKLLKSSLMTNQVLTALYRQNA